MTIKIISQKPYLRPPSAAAGVDAGHSELVGGAGLQVDLAEEILVALDVDLALLELAGGEVVRRDGARGPLDDAHVEPVAVGGGRRGWRGELRIGTHGHL